jgi:molybdate transport system permease protein
MMDWPAIWLTLELSALTVLILFLLGVPLAWWLAFTRVRWKPLIEALVALPIVLPPTVLGFYLLLAFGYAKDIVPLAFTFEGLVIASLFYSLPFVVQPLQQAFADVGRGPMEAAATLGASKLDAFFTVISPLAIRGYVTALVLGFAHTVGEFGVVLMVGGNIPGETRLLSISIYEAVETLDYGRAHVLSGMLLLFSFAVLSTLFLLNRRAVK